MADNQPVIGGAAVLDHIPDPDEWGVVVRDANNVNGNPYVVTRYDITTPIIYIGTAARGTLASATGWTIRRIQFTSGNPTISEWSAAGTAIWDDRAVTSYS